MLPLFHVLGNIPKCILTQVILVSFPYLDECPNVFVFGKSMHILICNPSISYSVDMCIFKYATQVFRTLVYSELDHTQSNFGIIHCHGLSLLILSQIRSIIVLHRILASFIAMA
jgi:hypothetical protein